MEWGRLNRRSKMDRKECCRRGDISTGFHQLTFSKKRQIAIVTI